MTILAFKPSLKSYNYIILYLNNSTFKFLIMFDNAYINTIIFYI
jgi:hypothetical protein